MVRDIWIGGLFVCSLGISNILITKSEPVIFIFEFVSSVTFISKLYANVFVMVSD